MSKMTVSAPGKLMLFGEHAVVYNRPCIVTAVSSRIRVTITRTPGRFVIDAPQVKDVRFVEEAVGLFQKKFKVGNGLTIKTESDFSCQYGFGSSSAVTVAVLLALSKIFGKPLTKKEIFDLGYKTTLNIQKVGSGFDIAAAVYGGIIYFLTGGKVIKPLQVNGLPLVVGYSGVKADTPTIVKKLKRKMQNSKLKVKTQNIFNNIQNIVEEAKVGLIKKNWKRVGELMNGNQRLLKDLGVSTEKLDKMCEAALSAGAYGAKLSGAGGGDCMITLVSEKKRREVERAIEKVGGQVIPIATGASGGKD
ncbi:mevalonate kinase [Candidatus Gottesmanbacteria bacterium]|nr:mevalonate kinase [Candidatus Gottesmanbacteria bacterium]